MEIGKHKSIVSKIVTKVRQAIARGATFLKIPENEDEIMSIRLNYFCKYKFNKCIDALDCTHVKIKSPGGNNAEI